MDKPRDSVKDKQSLQSERRRRLLEEQRQRRKDATSMARRIALETTKVQHSNTRVESMANQLMMPERCSELPVDLETDWIAIACPADHSVKRCLVVASNGKTIAYDNQGFIIEGPFQSRLPGGSASSNTYSILDCLRDANVFHVLDIMCWRGHPVYDCEAEFRRFWLDSKLEEVSGGFVKLPEIVPNPQAWSDAGLTEVLLYHRQGYYQVGQSPLCLVVNVSNI